MTAQTARREASHPRHREVPERRCLVTGEVRPRDGLMRFVVGPDDLVVPDLDNRLPGR